MAVVRMVVLVERDNPASSIAISRGWALSEETFTALDRYLRERCGEPIESGMRDLASGDDLYLETP